MERDHMGFIVAWDEGTLVFVKFGVTVGGFPDEPAERHEFEEAIVLYIMANDIVDVSIRYDRLVLKVAKDNVGVIRYEIMAC